MMSKNIWVQITTEDLKTTIETQAEIEGHQIRFYDDENLHHIITLNEGDVRYQKRGNPEMDFYFSEEPTEGVYILDNQTFIFTIKTVELKLKDDTINIRYELYQEDDLVSNHEIRILLYEPLEA